MDKEVFYEYLCADNSFEFVSTVFHLGACSSTTEWDGKYIMENNYQYSKVLLSWCLKRNIQFIYASSASVYGLGKKGFIEDLKCEEPINAYAYSKFLFDQYVRRNSGSFNSQVVGLRYFNVYGPGESLKIGMSSPAFKFNMQIREDLICKLFEGCDGYANGEQKRDFVFVEDCAKVNLWFMENKDKSGIFNIGSGKAESFNKVANILLDWHALHLKRKANIEYIPFPKNLIGSYQSFTKANLKNLRKIGFNYEFTSLENGLNKYAFNLNQDLAINL